MDRGNLDVLVATTPANVTYLSDFRATSHEHLGAFVFAVFPRDLNQIPALILPQGEVADLLALGLSWIKDVRTYGTFYITIPNKNLTGWEADLGHILKAKKENDALTLLRNVLDEKGMIGKRIGLDERGFHGDDYRRVVDLLKPSKIEPAYETFRLIRQVKNEEEVQIISEAIKITEAGIRAVLESAKIGTTGEQMVRTFNEVVAKQEAISLAPSISLGKDSYLQYNVVPSNRQLNRGDLLRFDVLCMYKSHFTDIGRTAVVGSPSADQRRKYDVVFQGEDHAIGAIRPGVKASDVFHKGVEGARKAGMTNFERHHCGHGIGLELYEQPLITPSNDSVIEEGAVINVETPFYEISDGGYMVEDTCLVTRSGVKFLTTLGRDLYEIAI